MSTATRLTSYGTALALIFGASWGLGTTVRPATPATEHSAHTEIQQPAAPPARVWQGDGYQVRLDGDLVPGAPSQVFATVSRDGLAVTDLEPHAGAFGHLVAVREDGPVAVSTTSDAAAPAATDRSGPGMAFVATVPTEGVYQLFLEFRHGGAVHVAAFSLPTRAGS